MIAVIFEVIPKAASAARYFVKPYAHGVNMRCVAARNKKGAALCLKIFVCASQKWCETTACLIAHRRLAIH
jgi:hypothetical protein